MSQLTKCTKKLPATCRIHGKAYREELNVRRKLKEEVERKTALIKMEHDVTQSWKVKEKDGITTVTVYRSGVPEVLPPAERGVESTGYMLADAVKPEGRSGRLDSMCVSPTLGGVARWVHANEASNKHAHYKPHQLEVDVDRTYVYKIRAWEVASSKEQDMTYYGHTLTEENSPYNDYWNTGITMREYMERIRTDPQTYDPQAWEILLNPVEQPQKPKPVSFDRVADSMWTEYDSEKTRMRDYKKNFRKKT